MSEEVDPEIMHAATLGLVLRRMREELDDKAMLRVLVFALERAGIHISTTLIIGPSPFPALPPSQQKASKEC